MNSRRYWKNRLPFLLTNLVCMAALTVFLLVCGNSFSAVVLILIVWALILLTGLALTYWKRKRQMKKLLDMAEQLSERYLISEVMELPEQAEDQVYYRLLKMAGKSMLEQIGEIERERLEYKEYIEQWIHEIKTPITAMKLLCENHRTDWTKELLLELEKTNRFTEQALYYARSEHTEKDYSVREMALSQVVHGAIADNKYLLLQSGMRLEVEEMQDTVYSDEKWVRFILNQLIANAVKYRTEQPVLRISTHKRQDQVVLGQHGAELFLRHFKGDLPDHRRFVQQHLPRCAGFALLQKQDVLDFAAKVLHGFISQQGGTGHHKIMVHHATIFEVVFDHGRNFVFRLFGFVLHAQRKKICHGKGSGHRHLRWLGRS